MNEVLLDRFDDGDDDIQVEVLDESQAREPVDDGRVSLTKEELEELKSQANSTQKLTDVFAQYAQKQNGPVNEAPIRREVDDEAEFERQIEADLFTNGKSAATIKRAIERFGGKYVAELQQKIATLEESVVRQNIRNDPIMAEYGDEVAQYLSQLPPGERGKKQAQEWAVSQVKLAHMDDIVAKKVAEALEKAKPTEVLPGKSNTSPHMDRGGVVGGVKKSVSISQGEARVLDSIGMPKEVYARWSSEQKAQFKRNHGIK